MRSPDLEDIQGGLVQFGAIANLKPFLPRTTAQSRDRPGRRVQA